MSKFVLVSTGAAVPESDITRFPDGTLQQTSSGLTAVQLIDTFMGGGLAGASNSAAPADLAPLLLSLAQLHVKVVKLAAALGVPL